MIFEKYRPKVWNELVGQDKAIRLVRRVIGRKGFDRGAFWIEGAGDNNSGIGKTSLALLIARQLADEFFITPTNGAKLDKLAVRDMERAAWLTTWGDKRYRVAIVDEAHAISQGAIDALLPFLEHLPPHFVIVFTTTRAVDRGLFGDDCGPFASRCVNVKLTNQGVCKAFARRAKWVAEREGLDGKPLSAYETMVKQCRNNLRAVLQRVEAGEMMD